MRAQPQNSREGSRFRDSDWCDWRWQAQHAVTDLRGLEDALTLSESERVGAARAMAAGLPIRSTRIAQSAVSAFRVQKKPSRSVVIYGIRSASKPMKSPRI